MHRLTVPFVMPITSLTLPIPPAQVGGHHVLKTVEQAFADVLRDQGDKPRLRCKFAVQGVCLPAGITIPFPSSCASGTLHDAYSD